MFSSHDAAFRPLFSLQIIIQTYLIFYIKNNITRLLCQNSPHPTNFINYNRHRVVGKFANKYSIILLYYNLIKPMQDCPQTPFELLDKDVYPVLNEALNKLINHIVKTQQVRKHQERLLQQRVLDELEVRKQERQKQKEELGSDYDESDDQKYLSALNMTKQDVDNLLAKRKQTKKRNANSENEFNPIVFLIEQLKMLRDKKE